MAEKKLSTWEVLRYKFPANEYVLIAEVSDASGFSRSRSLDYMLINLWESRGLAVTGIEVKSNRTDWLKELKNPAKQENHFKYCDFFYLLTDKEGTAKLEEIPSTWGWYHINDKQILKTMKAAPRLIPKPIEKSLMCAMLRRAADKTGFTKTESIQDKINEAVEAERSKKGYEREYKIKHYDDLIKTMNEFKEASGIDLEKGYRWEGKEIGEAVHLVLNGGMKWEQQRLSQLKEAAMQIHNTIESHLIELQQWQIKNNQTTGG